MMKMLIVNSLKVVFHITTYLYQVNIIEEVQEIKLKYYI